MLSRQESLPPTQSSFRHTAVEFQFRSSHTPGQVFKSNCTNRANTKFARGNCEVFRLKGALKPEIQLNTKICYPFLIPKSASFAHVAFTFAQIGALNSDEGWTSLRAGVVWVEVGVSCTA